MIAMPVLLYRKEYAFAIQMMTVQLARTALMAFVYRTALPMSFATTGSVKSAWLMATVAATKSALKALALVHQNYHTNITVAVMSVMKEIPMTAVKSA